mmetsp:Transcript_16464/g.52675  ORF Transcript_16464/g.52675 Transcript_16464/m.52675 type:complete len:470 (-) Transcript_16464:97-1506(-)
MPNARPLPPSVTQAFEAVERQEEEGEEALPQLPAHVDAAGSSPDDGKRVLRPMPHAAAWALLLQARLAGTERLAGSEVSLSGGELSADEGAVREGKGPSGPDCAQLPRDIGPSATGQTSPEAALSVYSVRWGLEARSPASATAAELAPPGRPWRVFAARPFRPGELVERCEVLLARRSECCLLSEVLRPRFFSPAGAIQEAALPLGFGPLYRREVDDPERATVEPAVATGSRPQLLLRASRSIAPGEELTVSGDWSGHQGGLPLEDCPHEEPNGAGGTSWLPAVADVHAGAVCVGYSRIHGRGVFAARDFAAGDVVELCPALVVDELARGAFDDFVMTFAEGESAPAGGVARGCKPGGDGMLEGGGPGSRRPRGPVAPEPPAPAAAPVSSWRKPRAALDEDDGFTVALALGSGALYNHSADPTGVNVRWGLSRRTGLVVFTTTQAVRRGRELLIDYGEGYWRSRKTLLR